MDYETSRLYIVRPSFVTLDKTKEISKSTMLHTVKFHRPSLDLSIAIKENGGYQDVVNNRFILDCISNHCCEGEPYVGIIEGDIMFMAEQLFKLKTKNRQYSSLTTEYLLSLKEFYTYMQIIEALDYLKANTHDKRPKDSGRRITYSIPNFRIINTDVC